MSENQTTQHDANFWENEVAYFETALEGIQRSYAILASLKENAKKQLDECLAQTEAE